jgi:hypothetical protein
MSLRRLLAAALRAAAASSASVSTPQHQIKRTGLQGERRRAGSRINAFHDGARDARRNIGDPALPKILILTSDGRDGYINAVVRLPREVPARLPGRRSGSRRLKGKRPARGRSTPACNEQAREGDIRRRAGQLHREAARMAWPRQGRQHPHLQHHPPDRRLRTHARPPRGPRVAHRRHCAYGSPTPTRSSTCYDNLIAELNNQIVVTFVDEEATPSSQVSYVVEAGGLIGQHRDTEARRDVAKPRTDALHRDRRPRSSARPSTR